VKKSVLLWTILLIQAVSHTVYVELACVLKEIKCNYFCSKMLHSINQNWNSHLCLQLVCNIIFRWIICCIVLVLYKFNTPYKSSFSSSTPVSRSFGRTSNNCVQDKHKVWIRSCFYAFKLQTFDSLNVLSGLVLSATFNCTLD